MSGTIKGVFHSGLTQLALPGTEAEVRVNAQRALFVRLTDDTGAYVAPGGGTTDEAAWTAGASSFSPTGGAFNDSAAALTSGQQGTARATANRALHVNVRDHLGNEATLTGNSLNVNVTNGAAGGTSMADKAAFTVGTTNGTPAFGLVRTDVPDLVVDATGASFASTLRRGLHVNLRTQAGVELLGQQLMAASIPVVLASNQSTVNVALAANQSVNVAQINGVTPLMGTGVMGTGSQRVTIASDNDPLTVKQGTAANLKALIDINAAQTLATVTTVGTVTNLSQMNGAAISMGTGVRGAGVQRVTIATDDIVPASQSGTWNIGTVTTVTTVSAVSALTCAAANAKVDIGLINAVTPLMGAGNTGTGSLRVTIASDQVAVATTPAGNVANAAADSGNPLKVGGVYTSAAKTALTSGNRGDMMIGSQGEIINQPLAPVSWFGVQATTITASTSETTIVTAGAAGVFNDLVLLVVTNSSATACTVTLKDSTAGTTRGIFALAANGGIVIPWHNRFAQASAAANWTLTSSASITSLFVHAHYVTRK